MSDKLVTAALGLAVLALVFSLLTVGFTVSADDFESFVGSLLGLSDIVDGLTYELHYFKIDVPFENGTYNNWFSILNISNAELNQISYHITNNTNTLNFKIIVDGVMVYSDAGINCTVQTYDNYRVSAIRTYYDQPYLVAATAISDYNQYTRLGIEGKNIQIFIKIKYNVDSDTLGHILYGQR